MAAPSNEKRRARRFPSDVRVRYSASTEVVEMEAVNVSLGGAYCSSRYPFELMTRLEVHLDLPGHTETSMTLTATAVVVRVEDSPDGGPYRLALWFQHMPREDHARLRRFLSVDGH